MITRYTDTVEDKYGCPLTPSPAGAYVTYDDYAATIAAKDAEIARLRGEVPRWIPCAERLPDLEQIVAGWSAKHGLKELQWFGEHWSHWPTNDFIPSAFTHWQPLPPAPRCDGETESK